MNIDIRNIVFQLILTFLKSTLNVILSINKNGISIIAIEQYKKGKYNLFNSDWGVWDENAEDILGLPISFVVESVQEF